jgi:hypothetical protein
MLIKTKSLLTLGPAVGSKVAALVYECSSLAVCARGWGSPESAAEIYIFELVRIHIRILFDDLLISCSEYIIGRLTVPDSVQVQSNVYVLKVLATMLEKRDSTRVWRAAV